MRRAEGEARPRLLNAGCALFLLGVVATGALAWAEAGLRGRGLIAAHLVMSAGMFLAWRAHPSTRAQVRRVLLVGIAARLLLLPIPAFTTHDLERYLWDGFVARSGFDPYQHAPGSETLAPLRAEWPPPQDNTKVATLYPPAALAMFSLASLAGPLWGVWLWKCLATLAALVTCALGVRWLGEEGRAHHAPLLVLSPIGVVESALAAHVDVFTALMVVLAMASLSRWRAAQKHTGAAPIREKGLASAGVDRGGSSSRAGGVEKLRAQWKRLLIEGGPLLPGVWLGVGALMKLLPALIVVPLALGRGWIRLGAAAGVTLFFGYGAALFSGFVPFGSTAVFMERWRFGSPVFAALQAITGGEAALVLSGALALLTLGLSVVVVRRSILFGAQLALAAPLIFAPVVFPWYVLPLIPLVAARPSAVALAWFTALPLTYEVIDAFDAGGAWQPAKWPLIAIGVAVVVGAALDLMRRRPCDEV